MSYTYVANGGSSIIKFYPKQADGTDSSELFTLAIEPATGVCGTLSNEQQGSDAGGVFVQATYTAPNAVPPAGTDCLVRATGDQGTDCTTDIVIQAVEPGQCCPTVDRVELGLLEPGGELSGQVIASSQVDGTVTITGNSMPGSTQVSAAGVLSGTLPTAAGTYQMNLTIADEESSCGTVIQFEIPEAEAADCPVVSAINLPALIAGGAMSGSVTASSDNGTVTFDAINLPAGVTLDSVTGAFGGTVPAAGTHSLVIGMSDDVITCTLNINIVVSEADEPVPSCAAVTGVTLRNLVAGEAITGSVSAQSQNNGTVSYAIANAPTGWVINSATGVITGTAPAAGNYFFTVTIDDGSASCQTTVAFSVVDAAADPACPRVDAFDLGSLVAGQAVSGVISATGTGIVNIAQQGLPTGMTLSAAGVLAGVAPAAGDYDVTLTLTDDETSCDTVISFVVQPAAQAAGDCPELQGIEIGPLIAGQQATGSITAIGNGTVQITQSGLPAGLTFANGVIGGVAPSAGSYIITITMVDDDNVPCSFNYRLTVTDPIEQQNPPCPKLGSVLLPTAIVGQQYDGFVVMTGEGDVAYAMSDTGNGLSIDAETGQISGTYTGSAGNFSHTLTVSDENGSCGYTINIQAQAAQSAQSCPRLESISLPTAIIGEAYAGSVMMSGVGDVSYALNDIGNGLSINADTGQIGGTYSGSAGNFMHTLTVTDDDGSCTYTLSIRANEAPQMAPGCCPRLSVVPAMQGQVGQQFSAQLVAIPGTDGNGVSFEALSGLPSGMVLAPNGFLSGIPTAESVSNIQIQLSDGVNDPCNVSVSFVVLTEDDVEPTPPSAVDEECVRLKGIYTDWMNKNDGASISDFGGWIMGAAQAFEYWQEQNPGSGDDFAAFTVWISKQPDCPDNTPKCVQHEWPIYLLCDAEIAGVQYRATPMYPAYIKVDRDTYDHLIANGDATAAKHPPQ